MKLSLKVEYACQVLAQLGYSHGRNELPHIEELAQLETIPANYLVQILNELRTAGLIVSKRGKQGGYALSRAPREISLLDVVRALEGELLEINPGNTGQSSSQTRKVWAELAARFAELAAQRTIDDLMQRTPRDMWYI